MPGRGLIVVCSVALVALAAVIAACGDGGTEGRATPGVSPAATGVETPTGPAGTATAAATPSDIRQEDLGAQEGLRTFLAEAGGAVDTDRISYADLTGDGLEEAVVPVSSGGEGGDIAVFVFGYDGGAVAQLLRVIPESGALTASVAAGALTVSEPVFAPGDPLCCPSELRNTTFGWDGNGLVAVQEEVVPAEGR
jgi:hypothetical protein